MNPFRFDEVGVNFFAPVADLAEQLKRPIVHVGHRLLDASDEAAMVEYLKLVCKPSPKPRGMPDVRSDVQADRDDAVDNREWFIGDR